MDFRLPSWCRGPRFWIALLVVTALIAKFGFGEPLTTSPPATAPRPALSVSLTTLQSEDWQRALSANGNVVAWEEAVIGAEISNYRLTAVLVNVGDAVKKGQVLARIADENVAADLAQSNAAVAEAEANLGEARFNAERARRLREAGFYSPQQAQQSLTAEQAAAARLEAARARSQSEAVRLAQTQVRAPDDGIISARTATVGSLTQGGSELFRLIRGGRLEWRAELTANELSGLEAGMTAFVTTPAGQEVAGRVRMLAPTVDPATRTALVYVDLPTGPGAAGAGVRAGSFARGRIELGRARALTLPQSAVVLRDGFAYVFRLGSDGKVVQTKVVPGRRQGERIEILSGLERDVAVVAVGAGFLTDGDAVRVVDP